MLEKGGGGVEGRQGRGGFCFIFYLLQVIVKVQMLSLLSVAIFSALSCHCPVRPPVDQILCNYTTIAFEVSNNVASTGIYSYVQTLYALRIVLV